MQHAVRYKDVEVSRRLERFDRSDTARYIHAKSDCEPIQFGDSGFRYIACDDLMTKLSQIEDVAPLAATQLDNHTLGAKSWGYLEDFGTRTTHTRDVVVGVARVPPKV